jgi:apolipoprotein N-acyltransferase
MAYETGFLHLPADRPWTSRLVAVVLGLLTTLTFEPAGLTLLAPFLVLPLLFIAFVLSPRDAGWVYFCFGLGLFASGTYWIHISVAGFGGAPWWVALILMVGLVLLMSFWMWIAGYLTSRLSHGEPMLLLVMAPAAWVLIEWLRGWAFTGFPWLAFGYGQVDTWLAGWAPLLGIYGASFAMLLSTTAVLVAVMTAPPQRWIALGVVIAPWLLGGMFGVVDWTEADGKPVRSTLIQGGVTQDKKWLPEQRDPTLRFYRNATRDVIDSKIVVWPEVAVPSVVDQVDDYLEELQRMSRANEQTIVLGILERVAERGQVDVYNAVLALDGERRQIYRKRHLVPYGEYTPLLPPFMLEWLQSMSIPYPKLSAGDDVQPLLETGDGLRLATAICYEDAYPAEMRYAMSDASIIINVSNDAWFGDSIAAHQHLEIARMRSLEFGRPTIRATNTGISAFIGHDGEIIKDGPQFTPVSLTASIQPRKGATPYANWGNFPIVAVCVLILGFGWIRVGT